jgi:hypothetical protein
MHFAVRILHFTATGAAEYLPSFPIRTHFLSIGGATRNETGFGGKRCVFVWKFQDFDSADLERRALARGAFGHD